MATHTDNRHYGTSIVDSTITVDTINQVDGLNPSSILSYLPRTHDISSQCNGTTRVFLLDPPVAQGTQNLFLLFLDGQALVRNTIEGDPDFFISNNLQQVVLGDNITEPPQGSTLIAVYVEDNSIAP